MWKRIGAITVMFLTLSGCTAAWINNPSRATEDLVHDLKLEGFDCTASFSSVSCRQEDPHVQRQAKLCTSSHGCVSQPCLDVRMVYEIRQSEQGVPQVTQTTERTPTTSIPSGVYSEEHLALLHEYCSVQASP